MTLFGWDTSHYDGPLSRSTMDRARVEGIAFLTAKLGEGLTDTEGAQDDSALANARDAGIPFIAAYVVPRTNATPAAQVARWLQLADAGEPWWRDFPGWFWQVDLERWSYDNVPAAVGIECAQRLRQATGRQVILYASRGQYGDGLAAWDGPLWNADYRAGPSYPGDNWVAADKGVPAGWAPYSGKVPAILQYTSSATIAGLTTCDANAFRGSVADFAAMIGGGAVDLSTPFDIVNWDNDPRVPQPVEHTTVGTALAVAQQRSFLALRTAQSVEAKVDRVLAALTAAPAVDLDALAAKIKVPTAAEVAAALIEQLRG